MKMSRAGAAENAISHQTVRLACASSLPLLLLLLYSSSAPEEITSLAVCPQMWVRVRRASAANGKMPLGGSKRSTGHPWTEANLRRGARLVHRGFVVSIKVGSLVEACGEILCDGVDRGNSWTTSQWRCFYLCACTGRPRLQSSLLSLSK